MHGASFITSNYKLRGFVLFHSCFQATSLLSSLDWRPDQPRQSRLRRADRAVRSCRRAVGNPTIVQWSCRACKRATVVQNGLPKIVESKIACNVNLPKAGFVNEKLPNPAIRHNPGWTSNTGTVHVLCFSCLQYFSDVVVQFHIDC